MNFFGNKVLVVLNYLEKGLNDVGTKLKVLNLKTRATNCTRPAPERSLLELHDPPVNNFSPLSFQLQLRVGGATNISFQTHETKMQGVFLNWPCPKDATHKGNLG